MKPAPMTHNTANSIYERQPPPAPISQKNPDRHPEPENGTAKSNGSKTCGNNSSRCLSMGIVCATGGGGAAHQHTKDGTAETPCVFLRFPEENLCSPERRPLQGICTKSQKVRRLFGAATFDQREGEGGAQGAHHSHGPLDGAHQSSDEGVAALFAPCDRHTDKTCQAKGQWDPPPKKHTSYNSRI